MRFQVSNALESAFIQLQALSNPVQRGREFEALVAQLLSREHFDVHRKNLKSNGRQVDLFATLGDLTVLIETKWIKRPAGINEVDQLRARLESAAPLTLGVLVSMSGFTAAALERVAERSSRPMVLINGEEVEACVVERQRLRQLIVDKAAYLSRNGAVWFQDNLVGDDTPEGELPHPTVRIVGPSGAEQPSWEGAGGYDSLVYVLDHQDLDWSAGPGMGACIDLDLEIEDESELLGVFGLLNRLGWITPEGTWRINQSVATWNGFGAGHLVEQLLDWPGRYRNRAMHHTEEVIYTDASEFGVFTLTADLGAYRHRRVTRTRLSFQLSGIPLDTSPFDTLAAAFRVWAQPVFRVRTQDAVQSKAVPKPSKPFTAAAYLVRSHTGHDEVEEWVEGVVCDDPFVSMGRRARVKAGLPADPLGLVAMWMRSAHRLGETRTYAAYRVEGLATSEAEVIRFMGDWA